MTEIKCLTVGHIGELVDEIRECMDEIEEVLSSDEDKLVKAYYARGRFQGLVQLLNMNIYSGNLI